MKFKQGVSRRFDKKKPGLKSVIVLLALVLLASALLLGCSANQTDEQSAVLEGFVVPTMPAQIPGYLEVDPDTGLHMTGTPTVIDFDSYRLKVTGKVNKELNLTYAELLLMEKMSATPVLECPRSFVDTFTWSGVSLQTILEMAEVQPDALRVVMKGADGYMSSQSLKEALNPQNFLAYEFEGQTLPVLTGFPLRAVLPGQAGNRWVKWLIEIEIE